MKEIYKLIIEKGGAFGIVCVVVLVISTGIISTIKKKNYSESPIIKIINFLKVFFLVSVAFIVGILLFNNFVKNQEPVSTIAANLPTQLPLSKEDSVALDATSELYFKSSSLLVKQYSYVIGGGGWQQVTKVDIPLNLIAKIKIFTFNNLVVISNKVGESDDKFRYDKVNSFAMYQHFQSLKAAGFPILIEYHLMSTEPVIGCIICFISIIIILFVDADGCTIKLLGVCGLIIGFLLVFFPL